MIHSVAIIVVTAIATVLTRALPFLLLGGKKELPEKIEYLGRVLPSAIMAILVVYCLKDINLLSGNHGLPQLIAIGIVVVLHLWKKNTLLSIASGTITYMILIRVLA